MYRFVVGITFELAPSNYSKGSDGSLSVLVNMKRVLCFSLYLKRMYLQTNTSKVIAKMLNRKFCNFKAIMSLFYYFIKEENKCFYFIPRNSVNSSQF